MANRPVRVAIHVNNAMHQKEHAAALKSGFDRHGIEAHFTPRGTDMPCDVAAIWAYKPAELMAQWRSAGRKVLVMERGYFPNRMEWSSLGWDGLNGRARFPQVGASERFISNWSTLLKPWQDNPSGHAVICGQVPGDAAVHGVNVDRWAAEMAAQLSGDVIFRPHPYLTRNGRPSPCPSGARLSTNLLLEEDLAGARCCVTYNSNSGVESVCAGIPTITMDKGTMAWDVTTHGIADPPIRPDRTEWAHRLAWCQWRIGEIADGTAWEHVRTCLN